jgi:hypothetical protein
MCKRKDINVSVEPKKLSYLGCRPLFPRSAYLRTRQVRTVLACVIKTSSGSLASRSTRLLSPPHDSIPFRFLTPHGGREMLCFATVTNTAPKAAARAASNASRLAVRYKISYFFLPAACRAVQSSFLAWPLLLRLCSCSLAAAPPPPAIPSFQIHLLPLLHAQREQGVAEAGDEEA